MGKDKSKPELNESLRKQAEDNLKQLSDSENSRFDIDNESLIHELRTHQIELEMQNNELHRTQLELIESRDRYADLYDFSPVGYLTISEKGLIIQANLRLADMLGVDRQSMLNQHLSAFVHSSDQDIYYRHRQIVHERHSANVCRLRLAQKPEGFLWVEINSIPVNLDGSGVPQRRSAVVDISEAKAAEIEHGRIEIELQQLQKLEALGVMVGGVAHEINNILQSMFLYGELVQSRLPEDAELRSDFQQVMDDAGRARDIVGQILTFSRKGVVDMHPQEIHDTVLGALRLARASLPPNIEIIQEIQTDLPQIMCDKTQVAQVCLNLCNNAMQAMQADGGTLTCILRVIPKIDIDPRSRIELIIQDTGMGMTEETSTKIFDPFFSTKEVGAGTGLGLSVVHGIVQAMGGDISVQSCLGEGTTFRVTLPTAEDGDRLEAEILEAGAILNIHSILIVEDLAPIRLKTQIALQNHGFKVDAAADGQAALDTFKKHRGRYDVLITDMLMPGMSGLNLVSAIRKLDPDIRIILSSGSLEEEDSIEFSSAGANRFIQKPWSVQQLLHCIASLDSPK